MHALTLFKYCGLMTYLIKAKIMISLGLIVLLSGCVSPPPRDVNNICTIFRQYPKWQREAEDVQKRWHIPIAVQMAIIHQESKFDGKAMPPRKKLFQVIPWSRPSSAYGYAQALHSTWALYKKSTGDFWSSRENFGDAVDFIGWYANQARMKANISPKDPYRLYLAYHEGIGGYQRKTYLQKNWLVQVARKVKTRALIYQSQLTQCSIKQKMWYK